MANINDKINNIRTAVLGKDIRESLASGIESINAEVESTTARQIVVDEQERIRSTNENIRINNESIRQVQETTRQQEIAAIKTDYTNYKNIMIAESNVAQLQNSIDNVKTFVKDSTKYRYALQVADGKPQIFIEEVTV